MGRGSWQIGSGQIDFLPVCRNFTVFYHAKVGQEYREVADILLMTYTSVE
jgi:hypothetical protein